VLDLSILVRIQKSYLYRLSTVSSGFKAWKATDIYLGPPRNEGFWRQSYLAKEDSLVIIRKANLADARTIAEIHVATWKTSYMGIVPQVYLDALKVDDKEKMWTEILQTVTSTSGKHLLLAETEGHVVGFSNGGPSRTPSFSAEVYAIYLLQRKQGQGIGKELFQSSLGSLRKELGGPVMLWVLEENPSLAFYKKAGGVIRDRATVEIAGKNLSELLLVWD
jgi:GNAT superfamily N-acetyltransferase